MFRLEHYHRLEWSELFGVPVTSCWEDSGAYRPVPVHIPGILAWFGPHNTPREANPARRRGDTPSSILGEHVRYKLLGTHRTGDG